MGLFTIKWRIIKYLLHHLRLAGPIGYQDASTHEILVEMTELFWEWVGLNGLRGVCRTYRFKWMKMGVLLDV